MSNKDFEDVSGGFDFQDVPEWENDAPASKKPQAEATAFDNDFSDIDFTEASVDQPADDTNDTGFGFSFDEMPTQASTSAEQYRGNPVNEFAEFGIDEDEFAQQAPVADTVNEKENFSDNSFSSFNDEDQKPDFDDFDKAFTSEEEPEPTYQGSGAGDFSDFDDATQALTNGEYIGQTEDPYSQIQDAAPAQPAPAPVERSPGEKSLLSKLIMPVGITAIIGFAGYMGYTMFMPSGQPAPVVVAQQPTDAPAFPSTLPGLPGLPSTETAQATPPVTPPAAMPADTAPALPTSQPELTFTLPGSETPSVEVPSLAPAPSQPELAAAEPALNPPVAIAPVVTEAASREVQDKLEQIGDIDSLARMDDIKAVLERLDALESKVDDLAESFASKVSIPAQPSAPAPQVTEPVLSGLNPNATPVATVDTVDAPLKPRVIQGMSLAGISNDLAWVQQGASTHEVRKGDTLPGAGSVQRFVHYRGDWVIVTSEGIIVRK